MGKLIITETWDTETITCGKLVDILEANGGNLYCVMEYFQERLEDTPMPVCDNWAWIQSQRRNKSLKLLSNCITQYKYR